MAGIGTLWRTVRHLKPEQIAGRVRFRLQRPRVDTRAAPPRRAPAGNWITPAAREISLVGPSRLRLLNVDHDLDAGGWEPQTLDRLRCYNLHYFDDLNAVDAPLRRDVQRSLIERWLRENTPGQGTGWEPYPASLRIVNWIKWFMSGTAATAPVLESLAVQARWLAGRLETHLLGNHLFTNAKALVFAGLYFDGEEAARWFARGAAILERELPEQILADGGHFERSPMYHALAFEDVLDLINITTAFGFGSHALSRALRERSGPMLFYLRCMSHPDGTLATFNDCAQNVAPSLEQLEHYAARLHVIAAQPLPDSITRLGASGYIRASRGRATILADVAPVGPDYLPGHAHADTLSFEMSLGSRRVIVNGGTSCYGVTSQRAYERSTASHSTVEVSGASSSEVWSSFRVGRRARPHDLELDEFTIACSHDGYRYLPQRPIHRRMWRLDESALSIEDSVMPHRSPAVARYIFAPGLRLRAERAGGRWLILEGDVKVGAVEVHVGEGDVYEATHAPEFGRVLTVDGLAVSLVAGRALVRFDWAADAHTVSH